MPWVLPRLPGRGLHRLIAPALLGAFRSFDAPNCLKPAIRLVEPHGYVQTTLADFLLTQLSRGTNAAARAGEIGQGLVDAYAQEARRQVANGTFYGAILFLSLAARKDI